jgi:hypothetical protein
MVPSAHLRASGRLAPERQGQPQLATLTAASSARDDLPESDERSASCQLETA